MNKIRPFLLLFTVCLFACFSFTECGSNKTTISDNNPAFTGHISGFTSGLISKTSTIKLRLMEPVSAEIFEANEDVDVFSFNPSISGSTRWVDHQTLEFVPNEKLPSGIHYNVTFDLGQLVDVDNDLQDFNFNFQTLQQAVFFDFNGLKSVNDQDLSWQKALCRIHTADFYCNYFIESC